MLSKYFLSITCFIFLFKHFSYFIISVQHCFNVFSVSNMNC